MAMLICQWRVKPVATIKERVKALAIKVLDEAEKTCMEGPACAKKNPPFYRDRQDVRKVVLDRWDGDVTLPVTLAIDSLVFGETDADFVWANCRNPACKMMRNKK